MEQITENELEYPVDELLSALQKEIRRGNEYEALYWCAKLESVGENCQKALWNRLKVIASEDIGVANPNMPVLIETLEKQYFDARDRENDSYRVFLSNAVVNLCFSRKSRIADDLLIVVYGKIQFENLKLEIPDYALDMHTLRGRELKRGFAHFAEVGAHVENEAFENLYKKEAFELLKKHGGLKSEFEKSVNNSKTKKTEKCLDSFLEELKDD